jgi:two-component system, chemotaxis family, sensor kinase CheA
MSEPATDTNCDQASVAKSSTFLEVLPAVCQALLQLEDKSTDSILIESALGGILKITAGARDAGCSDVAGICDLGERVLDAIRCNQLAVSTPVIDTLLEMCDLLAPLAESGEAARSSGRATAATGPLAERLRGFLSQTAPEPLSPPAAPLRPSAWPRASSGLNPELVSQFKAEGLENLQVLEAALLECEKRTDGLECIHTMFRAVHNIKGTADYVGLAQIKTLSHRLEDVLDVARSGGCDMGAALSDLMFRSIDELKAMITDLAGGAEHDRDLTELVSALEVAKGAPAATAAAADIGSAPVAESDLAVYVESAEQQLDSIAACCRKLVKGDSSDPVLAVLNRGAATLCAAAASLGQEPLAGLTGELLQTVESLRESRCDARERFADSRLEGPAGGEFSWDTILACCEELVRGNSSDTILTALQRDLEMLRSTAARLGETAIDRAAETFLQGIEAFRSSLALGQQPASLLSVGVPGDDRDSEHRQPAPPSGPVQGATSVHAAELTASSPASEPAMQHREQPAPSSASTAEAAKTMRVDQIKLDDYINLAGELLIARNALVHEFGQCRFDAAHHHRLKESVERIQRIVADIQANAMSMRMVPVKSVFQRFPRMVRDIAKAQDKQIEVQIIGEETELDKQVAEKLGDPLVHLIRNSADHGIELPAVRRNAGKAETGLITLKAGREGSSIVIEIIDDGRGIDVARLKAKAVEKGMLRQDQADAMPRERALELIFAAGLSTAKAVTDLSGRGVGMDVVRSNITDLGGIASVTSEEGQGTRIQLQLPLTLAVTSVVLVSSQDRLYALPMESVRETVKVDPRNLRTLNGRHAVSLRGQIVPVVSLAEVFSRGRVGTEGGMDMCPDEATDRSGRVPIVVVTTAAATYGIRVDELKGQQEIVIKPLPGQLGQLPGLGGATIMGDGSVVLILDPASLYDFVITRTDWTATAAMDRVPAGHNHE